MNVYYMHIAGISSVSVKMLHHIIFYKIDWVTGISSVGHSINFVRQLETSATSFNINQE